MCSQKFSKEELAALLAEKHRGFLTEYKREFDIIDRIAILKEKKEQLQFWVDDSKGNPPQHEKYLNSVKASEKEMETLAADMKSIVSSRSDRSVPFEGDVKGRHKYLKTLIGSQEEAISYWAEKSNPSPPEADKDKGEKPASDAMKKVKKVKKPKKAGKAAKAPKKK